MSPRVVALRTSETMHPDRAPHHEPTAIVHVTNVPVQLHVFLNGQARFIASSGFSVHAISSRGPDLDRFAAQEGVAVHGIDMTQRVSPLRDLVALWKLWRALRAIRPTVLHAHSPKGGLLGILAATLARVPVRVYHIRGLPHVGASSFRRLVLVVSERISCRFAHRVLAVSRSMREVAVADHLCDPEKIKVLVGGSGNGVDATRRFRPADVAARTEARAAVGIPAEALVVGFVGRVVRDKGIVELAAAWERLREYDERVHLLLVGPEEPKDPVPPEVLDRLRSDPRVHLTGALPSADRMYAAMDVVALPSYREGLPNVALEAAAMQLPIVATDVPGCVDAVVDGATGTLVPPRDDAALEAALRRYLAQPGLRAAHGAAARQRVLEEFRQEAIWGAVASEYRELLADRAELARAAALRPY